MRPRTIDEYLAGVPDEQRAALDQLRAQVRTLVPEAIEVISYSIPAFRVGGRGLLWFSAWKAHSSVYPVPATFLEAHADELRAYRRTKGSLHFTPEQPLTEVLVADLVRARLAELEAEARRT